MLNLNEENESINQTTSLNISNISNTKKRVHRYCPKLDQIKFSLKCEWLNCNNVSTNMDTFLDHIDQHLNQACLSSSNYECLWCDCDSDEFKCESTFKRHVRFHAFHTKLKQIGSSVLENLHDKQKESNEPQNAPKCNLDEQTRNIIPELPYKFECSWDTCDYTTDNPELFYRHIKINHVDKFVVKDSNSKCMWSQCEQKLSNRNRLVEHIRHHSQEKLVACPNCGALFASFTKFIDHCSRSSEIGNLCFQCSHCNKKFATNNLLKEHIRKHINKCKCPICDMTCIDKNDLSKHILYKHTTHKAFKCSFCDHSCKTQHDLQRHINLKHNERYEYHCDECEFKSKDVNSIKKHMLKFHLNGEGSCLISDGQQFSSSYMCHVCNKVYCQGSTLSKHLKTRHNFQWPSGHSRFRYKLESDGYYRLQTMRYESIELVEELNKKANKQAENATCQDPNSLQANQELTSCYTSDNLNASENTILISTSSLVTDSANSNTLNDLTNNQNIQINFNNLMHFSEIDQIQIQEQLNQIGFNSVQDLNYLKNVQIENEDEDDNEDEEENDETDLDEDMETDNAEYEILNSHLIDANVMQRLDTGDRIEFDLENFLNSNFRVKEQNFDETKVDFYNQENQEDIIEYKTIDLIDNQNQATLINNFN